MNASPSAQAAPTTPSAIWPRVADRGVIDSALRLVCRRMHNDPRNANHMVDAVQPPTADTASVALRWARGVAVAGIGAVVLPAVATIGAPVHGAIWQGMVGVLAAAAIAGAVLRVVSAWYLRPIGVALAGVSCWLLAQASYPVAAWLIAPTLGIAIACSADVGRAWRSPATWATVVAGALLIVATRWGLGRDASMASGAVDSIAVNNATST